MDKIMKEKKQKYNKIWTKNSFKMEMFEIL